MTSDADSLGNNIRLHRQERGLSQPELAQRMGIEQSYLSKLENDKSLPSKEIFQGLLDALDVGVSEMLQGLAITGKDSRLRQIPQVKDWYETTRHTRESKLRRFFYACTILMVIGGTFFYAGFSEKIFPVTAYEYVSRGVVLPGEPENVFHSWRRLTDGREATEKKEKEMMLREDIEYLATFDYSGKRYKAPVDGGHRYYELSREYQATRPENGWMEAIGVLCFLAGLIAVTMEKRLFRPAE
ncbi:helix-turn-helix domain-containing protein [Alteromonas sp. H39]|uniref:helix-turn-helix domain-containing protein n=1 Tax=Alteromonas sp. H39 TaxID=3389876 RepID=UPI0039E1BC35